MAEIDRIKKCIKGFYTEAWPEIQNMRDNKVDDSVVEAVLEELVEISVVGQEECAGQAQLVLSENYYHISLKNKESIIKWIFEYTEKYIDNDGWIIFLGFNLVMKLKWRELYVKYIESYDTLIKNEFDDDYIQSYDIEQYLK